MLKKLLFKIAKGPGMGKAVGLTFQYFSWAVPVKKAACGEGVLAFWHPQPSYDNHMILSPKKAIMNLQQMAGEGSNGCLLQLWEAARTIARHHPACFDSYTLWANGGKRQEVQQVHFHLFTDHAVINQSIPDEHEATAFFCNESLRIHEHPEPEWEIHYVLTAAKDCRSEEARAAYFKEVLRSINLLDDAFNLVEKGYSLVYRHRPEYGDGACLAFQIISGKRLKN